jgi:hypothetical protein
MSFTPGSDFDFTGLGFTPGADFDFSAGEAQAYSLALDQAWALAAPATQTGALDQEWALSVATQADAPLNQSWSLLIYTYVDGAIDQAWALAAPTFRNLQADQSWALAAPVFRNLQADQQWTLSAPVFADVQHDQAWQLKAPTFANLPHDQAWQLVAPQGGNIAIDQQWRLEATAVWSRVVSATVYVFALEQDGNRAEIPVENFSGQLRSGEPSFLQVSVPDAWTWAATIQAYAAHDDTEMVIEAGQKWSDGTTTTQEIARTTLRNVQQYFGARTASVNLDGTDTRTNPTPAAHVLTGASYLNLDTGGRLRYRVSPNFAVRPGDTVTVENDTFVVGELSYQVSASSASMEVAELVGE